MTNNKRGGFTLIEMLVVVAIIGLLSSVVVVGVGGARQKARDTKRVADIRSIETYLEIKYTTEYPDIGTTYPDELPRDPSDKTIKYSFCRGTDKQTYAVGITLEDAGTRPSGGIVAAQFPAGCTALTPAITCDTAKVFCVGSK